MAVTRSSIIVGTIADDVVRAAIFLEHCLDRANATGSQSFLHYTT